MNDEWKLIAYVIVGNSLSAILNQIRKLIRLPKINFRCFFGHEWSAEVIKEGDVVTAKLSCARCGKKLA